MRPIIDSIRIIFCSLLILTMLSGCATTTTGSGNAELREGISAAERGDYKTAFAKFRPPAEQGNPVAQGLVGLMYQYGEGVEKNYDEAAKWYRKSADQGNTMAQLNLGVLHENGQGVARDYVQAHKWFNLAGMSGKEDAIKKREYMEKMMTRKEVTEAQRLATEWANSQPTPSPQSTYDAGDFLWDAFILMP